MTNPTFRDYQPADLDAMYALDVACFEPAFQFSRRAMRRFAEARGAITVLAEADGTLAGFCIVQMEDGSGYVVTLDVAPPWRRKGLASRLMLEIESRARVAGATGMALHVFSGNSGAIRFYEHLGYERSGVDPGFYGRGLDALIYRKQLEPYSS